MSYQLVIVVGRSTSQTIKVVPGAMVVGRQPDCQLRIGSSQVSRRHCEFTLDKGKLSVRDLGSSNGTMVNGEKLEGPRVLADKDEIEIGNVKFRVERVEETALLPGGPPPGPKSSDTAISDSIAVDDRDLIKPDDKTRLIAAAKPAKAEEKKPAMDEDEVADFLMNIELDDEDKL